jgi:hypothetical protein
MIEKMTIQVKPYLPLKISEATWDGTAFQMYGPRWNFNTLSAWRITTKNKMIVGCYDEDSTELINSLVHVEIIHINIQTNLLKISVHCAEKNALSEDN